MVALSGGGRISGPPHAAHELCKFCLKPWKRLSTSQLYKHVNCNYHSSANLWPCNSAFSNTTQPIAAPSLVGFQWACDDGGSFVITIGALATCILSNTLLRLLVIMCRTHFPLLHYLTTD